MRIAVLILGLVLGAIMFVQTFLVHTLGRAVDEEQFSQSGAVGLLMVLLWLVASAVVLPVPFVSMIAFAIAGVLGFAVAADFPDLAYWGGASFILAGMSLLGWVGKRRAARRERDREARLIAAMRQPAATPPSAPMAYCAQCGAPGPATARYCSACGAQRIAAPPTTP